VSKTGNFYSIIKTTFMQSIGESIYQKLGDKTASNNVVIKSIYQKRGVMYAKTINGVFSLRVRGVEKHFGNPFSSVNRLVKKDDLIKVATTKDSVIEYINWIINSTDERAAWIRGTLDAGTLLGKKIIYYKELQEPSHATALGYLVANWSDLRKKKLD